MRSTKKLPEKKEMENGKLKNGYPDRQETSNK